MRTLSIAAALLLWAAIVCLPQTKLGPAPRYVAEPETFLLWEHGAPGALGNEESDRPTLTYYSPLNPRRSGTAVIVAPGGSYHFLASNHEGRQVANWLNALGVTAFVLKYRLGPRYHHPVELGDAQRAIRTARARAADFDIQPDRIGMMGFSAGGHLASTAGTHFDNGDPGAADAIERVSSRPDFLILAYPVISMKEPYVHQESATNLLGEHPDPKLRELLSNELAVTPHTPPAFLFATTTDTVVPPENSVLFYLALHKAGVPAELHLFAEGPHGIGLDLDDPAAGQWPALLINWLRGRKLLER